MEMELSKTKVGRIVADDFRAARVFSSYGIDFCCKGGISLEEACESRGLSADAISAEIAHALKNPEAPEYKSYSETDLIDHIENVHHKYVESAIPFLKAYLDKLCNVHGERHPELLEIRDEFYEASNALTAHMKKEELVLFPYIKAMYTALHDGYELGAPHFGHINNPISMMQDDHEQEGERFRKIEALSSNYTPPADGCQTYRVAFAMLKEFQDDLHTHIHLENNILFPKAAEMFKSLEQKF